MKRFYKSILNTMCKLITNAISYLAILIIIDELLKHIQNFLMQERDKMNGIYREVLQEDSSKLAAKRRERVERFSKWYREVKLKEGIKEDIQ